MDHHDSLANLTDEQRAQVTSNIIASELVLGELLRDAVDHLEKNNASCARCCLGYLAGETLAGLADDRTGLFMLLTIAVRRLAEQEYDRSVKA